MGSKRNPSRFDAMAKAEPDEPYFVLLGRDKHAAELVRKWATQRHAEGGDGEVVMEALGIAADMDRFHMDYERRPKPSVVPTEDVG